LALDQQETEDMRKVLGGRRLAVAVIAALTIGGPIALTAQTSAANPLNVADLGVTLQVAQATQNPLTGGTTITWQGSATVNPGQGTLLRASMSNDGALSQSDATLTVNTGGDVDPNYDLDPACSVSAPTTVTCSFGTLAAGQSSPFVYIAVETGAATSLAHQAGVSAFPGETVQLPLAPESPDSASASTTVANSGFAFLTDGESASFTSADSDVNTVFSLPQNATNGGGVFVHLYEGNATDTTCGLSPCYAPEARADFVQVGGTPITKENPLRAAVTYLQIKQTCNGLGGGSGCNPIYFLKTAQTLGIATQVPKCSTYAPNGITPYASSDPCVYGLARIDGSVQYLIALLDDIGFPIPLLG
jgi:hypothetical protein